jgi:outer membrane protein assembly factor BamB
MIRRLVPVVLGCVLLLATSSAWAKTDGGDLLWQDQLDFAGGPDAALAVAAGQGRVVAVGAAQNAAGNSDFLVRVYEAKGGTLIWKDRVDVGGANDTATAVVLDGDHVVVAGTSVDPAGNSRLLLRTYLAKTGTLVWEDRSVLLILNGLDVSGSRVLITGTTTTPAGVSRLLVRAYVAKTGVLAWQDRPAPPPGYDTFNGPPRGLTVRGRTAFVVGTVRMPSPSFNPSCLVRAYDTPGGDLLWESVHPSSCQALAVATDGKRVIVAGQGAPTLDDTRVQAYDADTGSFLWEARSGVGTAFSNALVAADVEHKLAYVAGWIRWVPGSQNQEAFLVQAYDSATGILRWEEQFPGPDPFVDRCLCHARDLVTHDGRVFAVGVSVFGSVPGTWLVRSYDARHGDVVWSDDFEPAGGVGNNPFAAEGALAVAVDAGRVFVVGAGINAHGNPDFILRAYDAH